MYYLVDTNVFLHVIDSIYIVRLICVSGVAMILLSHRLF